jgi:imidazolonepropionase-like amidohydrolase
LENLYIDVSIIKHVDCKGGSVIPGLVDGHTHPVFAGDRVHEFAMKLAGATYMEVGSETNCFQTSFRFKKPVVGSILRPKKLVKLVKISY